jgi:hypothetical protein
MVLHGQTVVLTDGLRFLQSGWARQKRIGSGAASLISICETFISIQAAHKISRGPQWCRQESPFRI